MNQIQSHDYPKKLLLSYTGEEELSLSTENIINNNNNNLLSTYYVPVIIFRHGCIFMSFNPVILYMAMSRKSFGCYS